MLKGVIEKGTGEAADIGRPAAGKTGTTQAYRDAWFCGYTPTLATSVWVGYPDAAKEMTSVHGRKVTGGSFPAEIWAKFMDAALAGTAEKDFVRPEEGLAEETICLDTGKVATEFCPHKADGLFLADAVPGGCRQHRVPETVAVPRVLGMTLSEAEAALKNAGLVAVLASRETSTGADATVGSQSPAAGTKVAKGSKVTLGFAKPESVASDVHASFTFTVQGATVDFDASGSDGPGTLGYEWDFGDGTSGEGESASHTYAAKGTYEVRLRVSGHNVQDSVVRSVRVKKV
jgi:penicillin-binding protein 1A